jgi:cell division protein FtsB
MSKRILNWLFAGVAVLGVLSLGREALHGPNSYAALREKHAEIRELERQNRQLARENREKEESLRKLSENQEQLELEIRKRLELLREGETMVITPDTEEKNTAPSTAPPAPEN